MIGVAKTGAPGLAMLTVPLMVFTVGDARFAAAWTVPMLIVGDVFAVVRWRRQAEIPVLLGLAPWVLGGMLLGGVALRLDDAIVRRVLASIILVMVVLTIERRHVSTTPTSGSQGAAASYGVAAGFATTLANAAGPVMSAYLLLRRMPKEQLVATGAWFYLAVNIGKLPIYAANGLFSTGSLVFDSVMAPLVALGAVGGFNLLRLIPQRLFDLLTLGLATAAALALLR